jgi:DNA-binding CsgD family transcriptional regulator
MAAGGAERVWLELVAELMAVPLTELPVEPLVVQISRTLGGVGCLFATPLADGALTGRLIPRELAVLDQLADGLTAASIGRRRWASSVRTVHKHLERVYAKLNVADRLSAVLRARDAGVLPGRCTLSPLRVR